MSKKDKKKIKTPLYSSEKIENSIEQETQIAIVPSSEIEVKKEHSLAIVQDTAVLVQEEHSKELAKKEDSALAVKENTAVALRFEHAMVVQTAQEDVNTSRVDTTQEKDASAHSTQEEHTTFAQKNKQKTVAPSGIIHSLYSLLAMFWDLLCSFITVILPNLSEIFSWNVFKKLCTMVRIEHTLFALPFAYTGLLIASGGSVSFLSFLFLTLAMFGIRSFAMTVNRIVDIKYDKANPRTQHRELVTGEVTMGQAKAFLFLSLLIFIVSSACISLTLLKLTPIPIVLSVVYSYMKRFTWYCHFALGLVLACAPIAGELAVIGTLSSGVVLLSFGILFWVAGFDILYSCQDVEFDSEHNLYSIPACFGIPTALLIAKFCHINTILFFLLFGIFTGLGWFWYLVWVGIAGLLLWEHSLLKADDLSKMNQAFFTINACISIAVLIGVYFS